MKKYSPAVLTIMTVVFLSTLVLAQSREEYFSGNPLYKGDVYFSLDKGVYSAGENLSASFVVGNMEDFPIVGAYLVVEIWKGGEPGSANENIFYEAALRNINLPPLGRVSVPFSYSLPLDLSSGSYSLGVYLKTDRTGIVGLPHIFLSPVYKSFSVEGTGSFPYAMISRPGSLFANETGQVGPGVDAGSAVEGVVSIAGDPGSVLDGLILHVSVCEWDDTSCIVPGDYYLNGDYPIIPSPENASEASMRVGFAAPPKPGAYAIRLELKDSGGRIVSLYRSRIIVKGETARIRKMAVDKSYYGAGEKGRVMVSVGPSPDHYTDPVITNARVSFYISSGGKMLYTGSSVIPELSGESDPIDAFKSFNFTSSGELKLFEVCSQVESSSGVLFDRYCYTVDSSDHAVQGSCGDGTCGPGEDSLNCCVDCGCAPGEDCAGNICRAAEPVVSHGSVDYAPFILVALVAVLIILAVSKKRREKK